MRQPGHKSWRIELPQNGKLRDTLPENNKLHLKSLMVGRERPIFMGYASFRDLKSFVIDGMTLSQLATVAFG